MFVLKGMDYSESLNGEAKYIVNRGRPFTYSDRPEVALWFGNSREALDWLQMAVYRNFLERHRQGVALSEIVDLSISLVELAQVVKVIREV